MSDWFDQILDPSKIVPADLYFALNALHIEYVNTKDASGIAFSDPDSLFFSGAVTTVNGALTEIGDYLGADPALTHQLLGDWTAASLVDNTTYFNFLMTKTQVLGLIVLKVLTTPPSGAALAISIYKNGSLIDGVSIPIGSTGYVSKDLSHTSVAIGDLITVKVITASSAVGLIGTLEV